MTYGKIIDLRFDGRIKNERPIVQNTFRGKWKTDIWVVVGKNLC